MNILVCGGAGYIGSHMVKMLGNKGCSVVTFDNLSSGHADAVLCGTLVQGCLSNTQAIRDLFQRHQFDAVMHFASYIQVGESVQQPALYYQNNVANTLNLLQVMAEFKVQHFIFSSTAATFGEPQYTPIDEQHPQQPINPYGRSKWLIEQALPDFDQAYGMKSVCLRYFNAAGADPDGELGERHEPETHLIPLVLQAASGRRKNISVFGTDYDTPDGTCIRDYIHVQDLCEAHWLALQYLQQGGISQNFNLGNGQGFSVKQVIDTAKAVTGKNIEVVYANRRVGDPARLVADASAAQATLGWKPMLADLSTLVQHAWAWERKQVATNQ